MLKTIFDAVLDMSLSGGTVILAVIFCRLLLGKCPKRVTVFLWLPAALQLILPVSVPSAVSFFNLLPRRAKGYTEAVIPENIYGAEPTGMTAVPVQNVISAEPAPIPAADPAQLWMTVGAVLWLAGMVIMLVWAAVQYAGLAGKVKTAVLMDGERRVYQSENIRPPFILGVLRPKIYVPYEMDSVTAWQVLAHERTHLRLGDHLTKLFAFCILTLHWFNPLCWLAFVFFGRDVEMRCDEAVLVHSDPKEYGTALVELAAERRYSVTGPLAFGETSVKKRVKHILAWKKPALWLSAAAVGFCAAVLIVCATDAVESPYGWTSVVTAEDFSSRTITYYGDDGRYSAELTDTQLMELVQCLRNVPESAMHIGREIRHFNRGIRIVMDDAGTMLFWDGEKVIQKAVRTGIFTFHPAWRMDDPALEAFFAELETSILDGQGTLTEESVSVSVSVSGTDKAIAPKWYPEGKWDHDYDKLPVLVLSDFAVLEIQAYWQPETLSVYEEYYHPLSSETTRIETVTHAISRNADGSYSLEITRQNPHQEEKIIYYIMNGEEKYIFKAVFPADRTEETTVVSLYIDPPVSMEETQWADTLGEYAPMA
ncbi:MAG: M56 family metallopeptidase, partial [Clostridia bacterium]|nr:M56 family metallopeptidase [Clostridia bacterium]